MAYDEVLSGGLSFDVCSRFGTSKMLKPCVTSGHSASLSCSHPCCRLFLARTKQRERSRRLMDETYYSQATQGHLCVFVGKCVSVSAFVCVRTCQVTHPPPPALTAVVMFCCGKPYSPLAKLYVGRYEGWLTCMSQGQALKIRRFLWDKKRDVSIVICSSVLIPDVKHAADMVLRHMRTVLTCQQCICIFFPRIRYFCPIFMYFSFNILSVSPIIQCYSNMVF